MEKKETSERNVKKRAKYVKRKKDNEKKNVGEEYGVERRTNKRCKENDRSDKMMTKSKEEEK